ncbi:hypothetical protein HOD19_01280 [bacterium]|jgi:hypothetical protein|nr:hypothetical protein [bacterium]
MNRKNIIILIIILILVLGLGFILSNKENKDRVTPPEEEIDTEIDTSDWVTYKSDQYGFEFKHPSLMRVVLEPYSNNEQSQLYIENMYLAVIEKEEVSPLSYLEKLFVDKNYIKISHSSDRVIVRYLIDDKLVIDLPIIDGSRNIFSVQKDFEMALIEKSDYYLWITSAIGIHGHEDGQFSKEDLAIIETFK